VLKNAHVLRCRVEGWLPRFDAIMLRGQPKTASHPIGCQDIESFEALVNRASISVAVYPSGDRHGDIRRWDRETCRAHRISALRGCTPVRPGFGYGKCRFAPRIAPFGFKFQETETVFGAAHDKSGAGLTPRAANSGLNSLLSEAV